MWANIYELKVESDLCNFATVFIIVMYIWLGEVSFTAFPVCFLSYGFHSQNIGVKREAEDAVEKIASAKKQKRDEAVAQAIKKEKADVKTHKKNKKVETSSSEEDSSDSEEEQKVVMVFYFGREVA